MVHATNIRVEYKRREVGKSNKSQTPKIEAFDMAGEPCPKGGEHAQG